jgi:hypothetical protein
MKLFRTAGVIGAVFGLMLTLGPASTQAAGLPAPQWRIFYLSKVSNTALSRVVAVGRRSAWAIGSISGDMTSLVRWNGVRWRQVNSPGPASFQADGLTAAGPDAVWLVGVNTRVGIEAFRFDGTAWHRVPWPKFAGLELPIVVLGPSNVWFSDVYSCMPTAGPAQSCTTNIWHWDGHSWTSQVFNKAVVAMGGIPGHLWLAALTSVRLSPDKISRTGRLAVFRLNGHAWQRMPFSAPRVNADFVTVAASWARDLWVVARPVHQSARRSGVFRFNGRAWTEIRVPSAEPTEVDPVLPDGRGGIWLGPWAHWTGRRWVNTIPTSPLPRVDCFSFSGLSRMPGSSDVWGVGWAHRIGAGDNKLNAMIGIYGRSRHRPASSVSSIARRLPVCVADASSRSARPPHPPTTILRPLRHLGWRANPPMGWVQPGSGHVDLRV